MGKKFFAMLALLFAFLTMLFVIRHAKFVFQEFEKVAGGLDEKELRQTKEQLVGNYYISMEDSQAQMVNLLV